MTLPCVLLSSNMFTMSYRPSILLGTIHSLLFIVFVSTMIAVLMFRTLHREIYRYRYLENFFLLEPDGEDREEKGWKVLRGDVFRPPPNSDLLCVHVGTGVQIFVTILLAFIFTALGFLSPASKSGEFMQAILLFWLFTGMFSGYSSARLYKMFHKTELKKIALKTAFSFSTTLLAILFVLKSVGALVVVPLFGSSILVILVLWFGVSVPSVFLGAYIGFHWKPAIENLGKTNKIPRQIPKKFWFMNTVLWSLFLGGIPLFAFSMISYDKNVLFSLICFVIFVVICAEIAIAVCYYTQLCSEDYRWWWTSFFVAGSIALHYLYFHFKFEGHFASGLSLGDVLIRSYALFTLTGTIGFYGCLWFTRFIYSSVKVD